MLMKGIFDPHVLRPLDHLHMGTPLPLRHADVLNGWSLRNVIDYTVPVVHEIENPFLKLFFPRPFGMGTP
jgi:hypothetical protein